MSKQQMFVGIGALLIIIGMSIVGCQMFDQNSSNPSMPEQTAMSEKLPFINHIVSGAESTDWTAYYTPGDSYFKLTIPVAGAIEIRYTITTGSVFSLFFQTTAGLTHEIGLNTINGVTDVVACVEVRYVENGTFVKTPANVATESGRHFTQYLNGADQWWGDAQAAGFVMSDTPVVKQLYCDGQLLVAQGLPALRPTTTTTTTTTITTTSTTTGGTT